MRPISTTIISCIGLWTIPLGAFYAVADEPLKREPSSAAVTPVKDTAAAERRILNDLTFLASDDLAGRGVGSDGIAKAGEFIAERFAQLKLKTDAFDGTPFQNFSIPGPVSLGPVEANKFAITIQGQSLEGLKLGVDYTPVSLGKSGQFSGQVAFAGYGITATEFEYDDYKAIDAKGKVVIVLRKEPQQERDDSRFQGRQNSQYAFFTVKELNATTHGAAALILVNDALTARNGINKIEQDLKRSEASLAEFKSRPRPEESKEAEAYDARARALAEQVELFRKRLAESDGDQLPGVSEVGSAISDEQVPTIYCTRKLVDRILAASGTSLAQLEEAIDSDAQPRSQLLGGVEAKGEVKLESKGTPVRNVIAVVPGAGALAEEYVVVGAHYDHVGMGGRGSLAPGTVAVHNGADDNGSGTVTMLEIARQTSELKSANRRSVIFMAFTAEESGLLGSVHYVRNPRWSLEKTVAMVNLDMVGRLASNELTVYGTGTAAEFSPQIDRLGEQYKFRVVKVPQGRGPSDHASFYDAKIPVYHFFTGLHNDYHRPSDDVDKVNVPGMARISQLVSDVVREIAEMPDRPQLILVPGSARPRNQSAPARPRLGVQLDTDPSQPASLRDINRGGAADKAGLKAGDIVQSVNDQPTPTAIQLRSELEKYKVGDTIRLEVLRGTERLKIQATLGE